MEVQCALSTLSQFHHFNRFFFNLSVALHSETLKNNALSSRRSFHLLLFVRWLQWLLMENRFQMWTCTRMNFVNYLSARSIFVTLHYQITNAKTIKDLNKREKKKALNVVRWINRFEVYITIYCIKWICSSELQNVELSISLQIDCAFGLLELNLAMHRQYKAEHGTWELITITLFVDVCIYLSVCTCSKYEYLPVQMVLTMPTATHTQTRNWGKWICVRKWNIWNFRLFLHQLTHIDT